MMARARFKSFDAYNLNLGTWIQEPTALFQKTYKKEEFIPTVVEKLCFPLLINNFFLTNGDDLSGTYYQKMIKSGH